ncbi:ABC transporter substrate-binding protein [Marinobacterium aestuariivivens]|uniref:ABC transporter substrate-binding protein n=1 Tax=Marinobacterium aestuariivivens TaxID=1698799 RepID=A0ABW2A7B1_9GAMM
MTHFGKKLFRLGAATLLSAALATAAQAADQDPIRIGAVSSITGVFAQQGEEVLRGIQFAVEEANAGGGIAGHPVELKTADDESTPEAGRRVAEKLARDGFPFLIGPISSSISLTLSQSLERWDALYVAVASKLDDLTGKACNARMFRTNHSDSMDLAMMGKWLERVEAKKFAVIAADYTWGHGSAEFFEKTARAQGKDVAETLYVPMGTKDFAPYIAQLRAADVDAIWVAMVGRDAIGFVKQAKAFGLTDRQLIGHALIFNYLVDATGDATAGVWGNIGYGAGIDTPRNKAFVEGFRQKYGRVPTENEGQAYNGVQAIFEGVRLAGSTEPEAVSTALVGAEYETIYGPATMRRDHQLVIPNYVGQVKQVGDRLQPVVELSYQPSIYPPASKECML